MRGGRYGRGHRAGRHPERTGGHGGGGRFSGSHARSAAHREPATKKHTIGLFEGTEVFEAPEPRTLVQHILEIATNPGDLVLDSFLGSFLGSGTTAAATHKTGRRWIGIEMGERAVTHCAPRFRIQCG